MWVWFQLDPHGNHIFTGYLCGSLLMALVPLLPLAYTRWCRFLSINDSGISCFYNRKVRRWTIHWKDVLEVFVLNRDGLLIRTRSSTVRIEPAYGDMARVKNLVQHATKDVRMAALEAQVASGMDLEFGTCDPRGVIHFVYALITLALAGFTLVICRAIWQKGFSFLYGGEIAFGVFLWGAGLWAAQRWISIRSTRVNISKEGLVVRRLDHEGRIRWADIASVESNEVFLNITGRERGAFSIPVGVGNFDLLQQFVARETLAEDEQLKMADEEEEDNPRPPNSTAG